MHKICLRDIELRIIFMLPDMLGIQHRVQDIFLVKKSTDPSVSWLLSWGGIKEPLGQSLQSSIMGSVRSCRWRVRCSVDLLGHLSYENHWLYLVNRQKMTVRSVRSGKDDFGVGNTIKLTFNISHEESGMWKYLWLKTKEFKRPLVSDDKMTFRGFDLRSAVFERVQGLSP